MRKRKKGIQRDTIPLIFVLARRALEKVRVRKMFPQVNKKWKKSLENENLGLDKGNPERNTEALIGKN